MSFLYGHKNAPTPPQKNLGYNTVNAATNEQGIPLTYLAGKRRFSGTFITDAFDISAVSVGGGGKDAGKGGGGKGTNYYAGVGLACCIGPCDGFHDFWLNGEPVYTSNTPLIPVQNGLSEVSNIATFQTANPHGLSNGQVVVITGADQPEFNGEFTITVVSAKQFQYTIPGSSLSSETATGQIQCFVVLDPVYRGPEDGLQITVPDYGILRLRWGTETTAADTYLPISGTNHPPYRGVTLAILQSFFLGLNQTNFQNAEFVLSRIPTPAWLTNPAWANISDEANPACVLYDLLTHPRIGIGLTIADFDIVGLNTAAQLFYNENFGISPLITRQEAVLSFLQQLCQTVDSVMPLSTAGLLSMVLIRPPANYGALTTLTDINLADIPVPNAGDWSTAYNQTRIVFPNRDSGFNNDFVEWQDMGTQAAALNIAETQTINMDWLTRRDLALQLVAAFGPASAIPKQTGKMSLLFTLALWEQLTPGTVFKNNFANATLARSNGFFRVTKRTLTDSSKPVFTIEYAADRSYLNQAI